MTLGPIGLWTHELDTRPWAEGRPIVQELEALGYAAIWFPEAVGRDALVASTLLLDATTDTRRGHRHRVDLRPRAADAERRRGTPSKPRSPAGSSSVSV